MGDVLTFPVLQRPRWSGTQDRRTIIGVYDVPVTTEARKLGVWYGTAAVQVLLLTTVVFGKVSAKAPVHPDYVPNEKTAVQIAEVVLVAQFGQERVNAQSPLRAVSTSKDAWLVQGTVRGLHGPGGNFGVWVNKHTACVTVIERMK